MVADIPGDANERLYFHRFRQLAGHAMGMRLGPNNRFWDKTIPQYCHEDSAVRHAFIAVGAAYHHFQESDTLFLPTSTPGSLEVFVLRQYNQALKSLKGNVARNTIEKQYVVTILCSIAFCTIEILRNRWQAALSHLSSSVRLLTSMPQEAKNLLEDIAPLNYSKNNVPRISYVEKLITQFEMSGGFLGDFEPTLILRVNDSRKNDTDLIAEFETLEDLHDVVDMFCFDVYVLLYTNREHRGDAEWWAQPKLAARFSVLQRRAARISELADKFQRRPDAPQKGCREYTALLLSIMYFRGMDVTLDLIRSPVDTSDPPSSHEVARFSACMDVVEAIRDNFESLSGPGRGRRFEMDQGIIPTTWAVVTHCRDQGVRERALKMIVNWPTRENFWDGPMMRSLFQQARDKIAEDPRCRLSAVNFGIDVPTLTEMLANVDLGSEAKGTLESTGEPHS